MRLRLPRCGAMVATCCALGCGSLDSIDHVQDLRLLGVRAEPPDQALHLQSDIGASQATAPVKVTALIADPNGLGRPIAYTFAVCAKLDTGVAQARGGPPVASTSDATNRCLPTEYTEFASGSTTAVNGWVEVSATYTATSDLLNAALALDPYHGLDGLRVPVQLTVNAGDQHILGTKLVVYSIVDAGNAAYAPNQNPNIEGINIEGVPWAAGTPFSFSYSQKPTSDGWELAPQFDANSQESYTQTSFTGQLLQFKELWVFDYFSTFGGFSPTSAGGQSIVSSTPESPDSKWLPGDGLGGAGTFWFVVRDGRGGEAWTIRQANLIP